MKKLTFDPKTAKFYHYDENPYFKDERLIDWYSFTVRADSKREADKIAEKFSGYSAKWFEVRKLPKTEAKDIGYPYFEGSFENGRIYDGEYLYDEIENRKRELGIR